MERPSPALEAVYMVSGSTAALEVGWGAMLGPRTPGEADSAAASGPDLRAKERQLRLAFRVAKVTAERTNANVPCPRSRNVPWNEDVRNQRV